MPPCPSREIISYRLPRTVPGCSDAPVMLAAAPALAGWAGTDHPAAAPVPAAARAPEDRTAGNVASGSKGAAVASESAPDADCGVAPAAWGLPVESGAGAMVAPSKLNGVWHFAQNSAVGALGEWHCGHSIELAGMPVGAMG